MQLQKLNHFLGQDEEFYFRLGQIVSLDGKLYQHQTRYNDSFGCQLIGHFMLDENDYQVKMEDASLASIRIACESLKLQHETSLSEVRGLIV